MQLTVVMRYQIVMRRVFMQRIFMEFTQFTVIMQRVFMLRAVMQGVFMKFPQFMVVIAHCRVLEVVKFQPAVGSSTPQTRRGSTFRIRGGGGPEEEEQGCVRPRPERGPGGTHEDCLEPLVHQDHAREPRHHLNQPINKPINEPINEPIIQ
jgi:hypothetical protein